MPQEPSGSTLNPSLHKVQVDGEEHVLQLAGQPAQTPAMANKPGVHVKQ